MSFIQELADELAKDTLEFQRELDDDRFYEKVGRVLMAASPTLHEAFMTSVRIRLAELRGRDFLNRAIKARRDGEAEPDAPRDVSVGH